MKEKILNFYQSQDKVILLPIIASLLSVLLVSLIFLIFYKKLPERLPLFYSLPWGEAQLITKEQFFLLPAVLFLITLINSFLVSQLHSLQFVLKRMLAVSVVLINLIILISAFKILFIFI